jgi:hypothetical protein
MIACGARRLGRDDKSKRESPFGRAEQAAENVIRRRLKPAQDRKTKGLSARLKSCPDTRQSKPEVFRSL